MVQVTEESKNTPHILESAKKQFNKVVDGQKPKDQTSVKSFDDIIKPDAESSLEEQILGAVEFVDKFRIDTNGKGVMFVNGKYFDMDEVRNIFFIKKNQECEFMDFLYKNL